MKPQMLVYESASLVAGLFAAALFAAALFAAALFAAALFAAGLGGCAREGDSVQSERAPDTIPKAERPLEEASEAGTEAPAAASAPPKRSRRALSRGALQTAGRGTVDLEAPAVEASPDAEAGEGAAVAPARSWFPETFLFAPSVATDAQGGATLAVTVPDRLTTWRILALAHDRQGGRAGAVTTFDSTLPTYVDPVLPDQLVAGDRFDLPILVVNTTDERVRHALAVEARGAGRLEARRAVELEPRRSTVVYVPVATETPDDLRLTFSLGGADRVVKTVPVRPRGRPMRAAKTGALAGEVTLDLPLLGAARPESVSVGLTVYPGALALLKSELLSAAGRMGLAEAAYALKLAGEAPELLGRLGGRIEPGRLRRLRLKAAQRLLVAARSPSPAASLVIAHGAGAHTADPLLRRLGDRMAVAVADLQRPDGTFTAGDGWSLQRVVVATAAGIDALAAVADDAASRRRLRGARIRAEGAFERTIDAVQDPYSAAAVLASGGVRGALAERLRERVRSALEGAETVRLAPGRGIVGVDGRPPSVVEATALAALALADDPAAAGQRVGLGNTLLGAYRPDVGWGDGRANLVALQAVVALFAEPLPERVTVTLYNGERHVADTLLAGPGRTERHEVRARVPGATQQSRWRLVAAPAVPGLAYALVVDYRVPWPATPKAGLTLVTDIERDARVGVPSRVALTADGPGGAPLEVRYALPAGVQAVRADFMALAAAQKLRDWRLDADGVEFTLPRRAPGTLAKVAFTVVPRFAGRLQAGASRVAVAGRADTRVDIAPSTWVIAR